MHDIASALVNDQMVRHFKAFYMPLSSISSTAIELASSEGLEKILRAKEVGPTLTI